LSEVQSAMERLQLKKLPGWLSIHSKSAQMLTDTFASLPGLQVTIPPQHIQHSYYKYYVFVCPEMLRPEWTRNRIIRAIQAESISCVSESCSEIYLGKAFPPEWRPRERLAVARELGETSLQFIVHSTLAEKRMRTACKAVEKVMFAATRPEVILTHR
jgi:dTDP-4-amino-4,6-dideoxygalactose transaminase